MKEKVKQRNYFCNQSFSLVCRYYPTYHSYVVIQLIDGGYTQLCMLIHHGLLQLLSKQSIELRDKNLVGNYFYIQQKQQMVSGYYLVSELGPRACAIKSPIVLYFLHPLSQRMGPSATQLLYNSLNSSFSWMSFRVRIPHQAQRKRPPAVYMVKEYRVSPSAIGTFSCVTTPDGMNITSPRRNSIISFGSWRIIWPPVRWLNGPSAPIGQVPQTNFRSRGGQCKLFVVPCLQ